MPPEGIYLPPEAFNDIVDESASLHLSSHPLPYEGQEDHAEQLRAMIRSSRDHVGGLYDSHRVGEIRAGVYMGVVPSIWCERLPPTIHESFLARMQVTSSDLGGMAEVVSEGAEKPRFAPGDPESPGPVVRWVAREPTALRRLTGEHERLVRGVRVASLAAGAAGGRSRRSIG